MASITKRPDGVWRARYRDAAGKEHARHFRRKVEAQAWLDGVTASLVRGDYVDPRDARKTVGEWCDEWLAGYASRRASTVRQAKVQIRLIRAEFGDVPLVAVKPSAVKAWTARLKAEGLSDSYVYAVYRRLAQIMGDAVHDGLIPRSPCSRKTSAGPGRPTALRRHDGPGLGVVRCDARSPSAGDSAGRIRRAAGVGGGGAAGQ